MSRQRVMTILEGWEGPIFPPILYELNTICNRFHLCRSDLKSAGLAVGGFEHAGCKATKDGYGWFCNLFFASTKGGKILILFPWSQDRLKEGGVSLDRSTAVYKQGPVHIRDMVKVIADLCLELQRQQERSRLLSALQ